ncbi:MAG: LysM peptidoglycan-binding domain-containing protein [Chloroflexi bacterium]|nr:LysM peptidoglycan-binding domain-containing protein [Chloroflexota bacterium]
MQKVTWMKMSLLMVAAVIVMAAVAPLSAAPASSAGNLLVNPGFESPYVKQCCQTDLSLYRPNTLIDEVQVPQGWFGWWRQPDSAPEFPSRCDLPTSPRICAPWHRPEWREAAPYANRIRSGNNAQKYFTFHSIHEAGMYQRVSGVTPGQRLQFSAYMMAWSTPKNESLISEGQQSMNLRVGIDPFGGTDPFSSNIVWGKAGDSYDVFSQFTVEAVAASSAVTVFTYSRPIYSIQHNDVYVDDGALVVVGTGSAPSTTSTKPATSTGASTKPGVSPFPDTAVDPKTGDILYVIKTGDTAWSLSLRFNTTVSQLAAWNKEKTPNIEILRLGKTIIVGKVKLK